MFLLTKVNVIKACLWQHHWVFLFLKRSSFCPYCWITVCWVYSSGFIIVFPLRTLKLLIHFFLSSLVVNEKYTVKLPLPFKLIFLYSSIQTFSFIPLFLKLLYYVPLYGSIMLLLFYCYYSAWYSKCTDNLNTFVSLQCQKILSEYQIFFSCHYLYCLYARTCFQRH